MHIVGWHRFQFERLANLPNGKLKLLFGLMKNASPCPRVRLRTVNEPDQSILREHWVFIFPVIPVYDKTEDLERIINWSNESL